TALVQQAAVTLLFYMLVALIFYAMIYVSLTRQALGLTHGSSFLRFSLGAAELRMYGAILALTLAMVVLVFLAFLAGRRRMADVRRDTGADARHGRTRLSDRADGRPSGQRRDGGAGGRRDGAGDGERGERGHAQSPQPGGCDGRHADLSLYHLRFDLCLRAAF